MSWTKYQLVVQAFEKAGMASYVFDLTPEQLDSARRDLDSMMATWAEDGIYIGYNLSADAEGGDINEDSGVQTTKNEAVYTNLSLLIVGNYGKSVPASTALRASSTLDSLLTAATQPQPAQLPSNFPAGAGNKPWQYGLSDPFLSPPDVSPLRNTPNGNLDFLGN